MNGYENTYDKYLTENDQFIYDEQGKKSAFLKQDTELFIEESYVPGRCIRVKHSETESGEEWQVLIDNKEHLVIKGSRFSTAERAFFRGTKGVVFIINGIKDGWKSVAEFKRHLREHGVKE